MKNHLKYLFVLLLLFGFGSCKAQEKAVAKEQKTEQEEVSAELKKRNAQLFADGVRERITGNTSKAFQLFEQALETDPNDHASMYELAEMQANKGNMQKALQLMEKAVELDPDNSWYLVRVAQIYKHIGNYEAYADVFYALTELFPSNPEYFSELSSALVLQGKFADALKVYEQIEKQIGANELLSLQKHNIYKAMDQPEGAIAEIQKLADAFPYETRYHAMLAELYMEYGSKDKALEAYKTIKSIDPEDPYVHISLYEYYLSAGNQQEAFRELVLAFENKNLDVDTKIQILIFWLRGAAQEEEEGVVNQALKLVETLVETHPESARAYHMLAEMQFRDEKFELARHNFYQSIAIDSSVFMVWENLLFAHINLLDFAALEQDGKRTTELFPEQPVPYYFTAVAKYQNKKYEQALQTAERGRRFVVGNDRLLGEFYTIIGDTQHKLGNHAASDEAYNKSLTINTQNATVLNNYAYYLSLRNDQLEKAEEMSRKAVELRPEVAAYLDTYAWIMYKKGRYEEARTWIEKALEHLEEDSAVILEHYGDILYKLNEKELALDYWKKAQAAGEASENIDRKVKDGILYE
jgi:tetratricopeptide (TPR) repeat protein